LLIVGFWDLVCGKLLTEIVSRGGWAGCGGNFEIADCGILGIGFAAGF